MRLPNTTMVLQLLCCNVSSVSETTVALLVTYKHAARIRGYWDDGCRYLKRNRKPFRHLTHLTPSRRLTVTNVSTLDSRSHVCEVQAKSINHDSCVSPLQDPFFVLFPLIWRQYSLIDQGPTKLSKFALKPGWFEIICPDQMAASS